MTRTALRIATVVLSLALLAGTGVVWAQQSAPPADN
jgi:hypothetical protein